MPAIRTLKNAIARASSILHDEGPLSLARRTLSFAAFQGRRLYWRRDCYLYLHHLVERDPAQYLPRLDSYEFRVLESEAQAERLVAEGFEDFRQRFLTSSRNLSLGAVAFCVFVDRKLAHIGWVATDDRGKPYVDPLPFDVAFGDGEACTGGTYTMPEYRGKGLMAYGYYERFEYLRNLGYSSSRNSVERNNVSSQRAHAEFSPEILGTGRFTRFLFWSRWTECPFVDGPRIGMPSAPDR
ncbi:hypothetical protein ACFLUT_02065 [Chloroflexota bacterium]